MPSDLQKTRKAMEKRGIDLLIVTDPSNMAWLTGYDGWSFYVHQGRAGAARRRTDLVWPRPGCQRRQAHGLSRPRQHHRLSGSLCSVHGTPSDGLPVRRSSPSVAGTSGTIAVEMDNYWFSAAAYAIPRRSICRMPGSWMALSLVNWQRAVKSPTGDRIHAKTRPASLRLCTSASSTKSSPACANAISSPRSTTQRCAVPMVSAAIIRPSCRLLPSGAEASAPAPDLGRQADAQSAKERSSRLPAATSAITVPCRAPCFSANRHRSFSTQRRPTLEGMEAGSRCGKARQCLRGHRQCVLRRSEEIRHRQG